MPLVEYRSDRKALSVVVAQGGKTLNWGSAQVVGGYKNDVDLTAPVVFAGFGITAPELGYDDYKGIEAQGKIVLIFDHEPQETDARSIFNGTGNTRYATSRVKVLNAQAHGAVAVLIVAEPNRKHLTNMERSSRIGGSITRATPLPLQAIEHDEVHIPALTLLKDELAVQLMATSGTTPAAVQTVIDSKLTPQSQALPDTVVTLHLRNASRTTGVTYNVAGLLEGSDPKLAAETVLISGHHDHDGESPTASGGMDIWHGADDNGSGTVGVVELAHAFCGEPGLEWGEAEAVHPVCGLCKRGARAAGELLDGGASAATAGDDAGDDQLRYDWAE